MFLVDTNIFIPAASVRAAEHEKALDVIQRWRRESEPWLTTWPIVYECLRVVTHRGVWPKPLSLVQAWSFFESLFAVPHFSVLVETPRHLEIARELIVQYPLLSGNILHDFHTAAVMKEHGVTEIRTADRDFHRFRFLRVVNPLAA